MAHGFLNGSNYNEETMSLAQLIERTITELKLPAGVKVIGDYAFDACKGLTRVHIPSHITKIGQYAFHNCEGIEELTFDEGVEFLGTSAFYRCKKLKEVIVPDSVTTIQNSLFHTCSDLERAVMGIGVITAQVTMFQDCTSLREIIFKGSIRSVNKDAFKNCTNCKIYDFSCNTDVPSLTSVDAFTGINENAKIFVPLSLYNDWCAATNWTALKNHIQPVYDAPEVVVPDQVSEGLEYELSDNGLYYEIVSLASYPNMVLVIPSEYNGLPVNFGWDCTMQGNPDLVEVCVSGVTFSYYQFSGCPNIKKMYLDNITIQSFDFYGLTSLEYVKFTGHNSLASGTFTDCENVIFDFSECTEISQLDYGREEGTFGTNPTILVPLGLYGDWINATNWNMHKEYIFPAK